jgi:hypothetical protein
MRIRRSIYGYNPADVERMERMLETEKLRLEALMMRESRKLAEERKQIRTRLAALSERLDRLNAKDRDSYNMERSHENTETIMGTEHPGDGQTTETFTGGDS